MLWSHEVSSEWLLRRKATITGTELANLVPAFKRTIKQREKKSDYIDQQFFTLWAEKNGTEELITSSPSSAAARGHVMEPYAIQDYNVQCPSSYYWHWDDCIICNPSLHAGFSPDGLDIPQPYTPNAYLESTSLNPAPTKVIEVKSYSMERHVKSYFAVAESLDQRYQVAAAMLVCPSILEGTLLFYNPSAPKSMGMFIQTYTRDTLKEEIEMIKGVLDIWNETCDYMETINTGLKALHTEEEIYNETMLDNENILSFK